VNSPVSTQYQWQEWASPECPITVSKLKLEKMKWFIIGLLALMQACSGDMKYSADDTPVAENDTQTVIRQFIYGLWSLDSGNTLSNEGFYFRSDGTVEFVAGESSGTWKLSGTDTLQIVYSFFNEEYKSDFRIDSLSSDRMILVSKGETHLFRKVPFGINNEGSILQGFSGSLKNGESRKYSFKIPNAKKIALKLNSGNPKLFFRVYSGSEELSSTDLREWSAIMVRSGSYDAVVTNNSDEKTDDVSDFDLKVVGY
jgi:hypothetical protein